MEGKNHEEENHLWFMRNLPNLTRKYDNQYIVIKNKTIIASYPSYEDAVDETLKTEEADAFSIELCSRDKATPPSFFPRAFHLFLILFAAAFILFIGFYPFWRRIIGQ